MKKKGANQNQLKTTELSIVSAILMVVQILVPCLVNYVEQLKFLNSIPFGIAAIVLVS